MKNYFTLSNYFICGESHITQVYSISQLKVLTPPICKNGYRMVNVKDDDGNRHMMTYARLLLILSNPQEDYTNLEVDHVNRDKLDDRLENLRWVSHSENIQNCSGRNRIKNAIVIYDHNNEEVLLYDKELRLKNIWPRITIQSLAKAKEGSHYSKKHNISVFYDEENTKTELERLCLNTSF